MIYLLSYKPKLHCDSQPLNRVLHSFQYSCSFQDEVPVSPELDFPLDEEEKDAKMVPVPKVQSQIVYLFAPQVFGMTRAAHVGL